ncbi:Abi family protein [Leeuwenhoekiella polynyae]|nr:Abi family protein [Leeuwenhoekiella polynyae]
MKNTKLSATIDEQIEILKGRGMTLDFDEQKTKDILGDIGYYRLGFYWRSFDLKYSEDTEEEDHKFKEGTHFSTIVELYYLNYELRLLLLRYLHRAEINLRSKIIYRLSRKYKTNPLWFCDKNIMEANYVDKFNNSIYKNIKFWNKPISYHHKKYDEDKYAPAWKTIEFFDFGQTLGLFQNLKFDADRKMVIRDYPEFFKTNHFRTAIRSLIELRNACSHGSVLFDYRGNNTLPYIDGVKYNEKVPKNFDSQLRLLSYFIGKISQNRKKELHEKLNMVFAKFSTNPEIEEIVKNEIGYIHFK